MIEKNKTNFGHHSARCLRNLLAIRKGAVAVEEADQETKALQVQRRQ